MHRYLPKFSNGSTLDPARVTAYRKQLPNMTSKAVTSGGGIKIPGPASGSKLKTDFGVHISPIDSTDILAKGLNSTNPGITQPVGTTEVSADKDPQVKTRKTKINQESSGNFQTDSSGGWGSTLSQGVGAGASLASNFIDIDEDSSYQQQMAVGNALMKSGNPYAMAAGAIWNAASTVDQALGINVNTLNKNQASAAGINKFERAANNVLGFLPGTFFGAAAGKTNENLEITDEALGLASGYSGAIQDMNTASSMGDKTYLFGKGKANRLINEANRNIMLLTELGRTNSLRKQSDYGSDIAQQNLNRYAGTNYMNNRIGKEGMKLMPIEEVRSLLNARKIDMLVKGVQSFQNGGVIGIDTNVIPEGKLHAHLNHLGEINSDLDVTRKGIPVVVLDESGELIQCAEIEREEIVLTKTLTDKLEALYKIWDDESLLEAGKLLATELVKNTIDNGNEIM